MRLCLMRHGIAEDAGPATGHRDEPRALTPEGAKRMRRAARGLGVLGLLPEVVVCSPLRRCQQTAQIVADTLGADLREDRRLAPGARTEAILDLLLEHPGAETLMLCGHEPDMSRLTSDLCAGGRVEFRKGALAVIELVTPRPAGGGLVALYPPTALRRLAKPG